jgi:hypothetical protein
MIRRSLLMLTLVCGFASPVFADEPALIMQVQPAGKLLDTVVKLGNRLKPPGPGQDVTEKQVLRELFGTDDITGLDRDRPGGLIVYPDANLAKSRIIIAVPVTNADQFRGLLGRLGIKLAKDEASNDGIEGFGVPFVSVPFYVRFHELYAYVSPGNREALDPKRLPAAATTFDAKEPNMVVARLRLDRVPDAARQHVIAFWQDEVEKAWAGPGAPPEAQAFAKSLTDLVGRVGQAALADGREAVTRFDLDPATAGIKTEFRLEPKPGTGLAKDFAAFQPTTNRFAGLAGPDTVGSALVRLPLFAPDLRSAADSILDVIAGFVSDNPAPLPGEVIAAVRRSVKAGELALGIAVRGPDKNGLYTAAYGVTLADTGPVEKAVRATITDPRQAPGVFKLDAEKVGSVSVHHTNLLAVLQGPVADGVKKVFGDGPVRFAFGPDMLVASFGPDGLALLTDALAMKPLPAPLVDGTLSVKRLLQLITRFDPASAEEGRTIFDDIDRLTLLRLSADGGPALTVKFTFSALLMPRASALPPPGPRPPGR